MRGGRGDIQVKKSANLRLGFESYRQFWTNFAVILLSHSVPEKHARAEFGSPCWILWVMARVMAADHVSVQGRNLTQGLKR